MRRGWHPEGGQYQRQDDPEYTQRPPISRFSKPRQGIVASANKRGRGQTPTHTGGRSFSGNADCHGLGRIEEPDGRTFYPGVGSLAGRASKSVPVAKRIEWQKPEPRSPKERIRYRRGSTRERESGSSNLITETLKNPLKLRFASCVSLSTKATNMEARVGIEPTDGAFAELCLTTWLPRP